MRYIQLDNAASMELYWLALQLQREPEGSERRISLLSQMAFLRYRSRQLGDPTLPRIELLTDYQERNPHFFGEGNPEARRVIIARMEASLSRIKTLIAETAASTTRREALIEETAASTTRREALIEETAASTTRREASIARTEALLARAQICIDEINRACARPLPPLAVSKSTLMWDSLSTMVSFEKIGTAWRSQKVLLRNLTVVTAFFSLCLSATHDKCKERQSFFHWLLVLFILHRPIKTWVQEATHSVGRLFLRSQRVEDVD